MMTIEPRKWWQKFLVWAHSFQPKPWMGVATIAVMVGLLGLGLITWLVPNAAAKVVHTETPTAQAAIVTTVPTHTPVPTVAPTPTPIPSPTPIPMVHVVWTENVSVYLLAKPGEEIINAIPNGDEVEVTGAGVVVGGITWLPVRWQMVDGYLADYEVYEVSPGYEKMLDPGTSLFKEPGGAKIGWVSPGTPFYRVTTDGHYLRISLPDGGGGWVNAYAEAVP